MTDQSLAAGFGWPGRSLVVIFGLLPAGLIKLGANTISLESRTRTGETDGNLDDFIVTDLILWYQAG